MSGPQEGTPNGVDRLARMEHNALSIIDPARSYESATELGKMARDLLALVEIAKAARRVAETWADHARDPFVSQDMDALVAAVAALETE